MLDAKDVPPDVTRVIATMAISGMYLDEEFIKEMIKVSNGEKTSGEVRDEIIKKFSATDT